MMKELNELVWYAESSLWRDESLLDFLSNGKPEVRKIYQAIRKGHFKTNEEAARSVDMSLTTFKKYGKELRDHLRQMVFFYNDEKARADVRVRNLFEGIKNISVMRMLYARGCRVASRNAAEELLRRGVMYEYPEFVFQASIYLKECVLRVNGSEKEFDYYAELQQQYKTWMDLEYKAWDYLQRVQLPYRRRAAVRPANPTQTNLFVQELSPYEGQVPSVMFHVYYYLIRNHLYLETFEYANLLDNCTLALEYLRRKPYQVQNLQASFHYMKVIAYLYLGKTAEGAVAAEEGLRLAAEGTPSWFSALEVYAYLMAHARDFKKAAGIYLKATQNRRLQALHGTQQENWQIIGAYCYIALKLSDTPLPVDYPVFRSRKFLNDVSGYTQEKGGMNTAILIAHVLLQFIEGRDLELWDRIQSLEKYQERYLTGDPFVKRSALFIKILMALARSGNQADAFAYRVNPLLQTLRLLPLQLANQAHELEIIPFEYLTELLAYQLSKHKKRKTSLSMVAEPSRTG